jgi:hypothetical protein
MSYSDELEKLVNNQERKFIKTFNDWIKTKRSPEALSELEYLLERGRIEEALDLMAENSNFWPLLFLQIYVAAGVWEAIKSPFDYKFDPLNKADYPRSQSLSFTNFLFNTQKEALRNLVYTEYASGKSWKAIAKIVQDSVGLTARQMGTAQRYENLLRSDIDQNGKPTYTEKQIASMVARRRRQLAQTRAMFAAKEEVDTLIADARSEATKQAQSLFGVESEKEWVSRKDDRVRFYHTHASLDGQKQPFSQPFISASGARMMHPKDRSMGAGDNEIMGCRCRAFYSFPES